MRKVRMHTVRKIPDGRDMTMKRYTAPEIDLVTIYDGDIITTSVGESPEKEPGTEGPVVDVEAGQWNW